MAESTEHSQPGITAEGSTLSEQSEQHGKNDSVRVGLSYQVSELPELRTTRPGATVGFSDDSEVKRLDMTPVDAEDTRDGASRKLRGDEHREFLAALEYEGKDFAAIAKACGGDLTARDIILHYYCVFKHSDEYKSWKSRVEEQVASADGKLCMYLRSRVRSEHPADPMGVVRRRIRYKFVENGKSKVQYGVVCARTPTAQGYYRVRFEDVDHIMMVKIAEDNRGSTWDFAEDSRGDIPEVTSAERRPRSTMSRKSSYASFVNENWSDGSGGDSSPSKDSASRKRKQGSASSLRQDTLTAGGRPAKSRKALSKNAIHKGATSGATSSGKAAKLGKAEVGAKRGKGEKREKAGAVEKDDSGCRWSAKRVDLATSVIVEVLQQDPRGKVPRHELREQARTRIGDTGLLDWVLKQLGGRVVQDYVVCRELNTANRMLEFRLEKADSSSVAAAREERLRVLGAEAAAKAAARGEAREMKEAARAMVEGVALLRSRSKGDLTKSASALNLATAASAPGFAPPTPSGAGASDSWVSDKTGAFATAAAARDDPSVHHGVAGGSSGGEGSIETMDASPLGGSSQGAQGPRGYSAGLHDRDFARDGEEAAAAGLSGLGALFEGLGAAAAAAATGGGTGTLHHPVASRVSSRVRQPARKVLEAVDALASGYKGKRPLEEGGAVGMGGFLPPGGGDGHSASKIASSQHESAMRAVYNVLQT